MGWDPIWEMIFSENEWGKYPGEEFVRFVAQHYYSVANRPSVRFLELGCGTGANVIYLAREGFSVVGVDGSATGLEITRRRLCAEKLTCELHQGDVVRLAFEDGVFDCVIDVECLSANTLADSYLIVSEAFRVLKKGGRFFSKTFATGITGEEGGVRIEDEAYTFSSFSDGILARDMGTLRLTPEDQIPSLYRVFNSVSYDYVVRTSKERENIMKEWVIVCGKT